MSPSLTASLKKILFSLTILNLSSVLFAQEITVLSLNDSHSRMYEIPLEQNSPDGKINGGAARAAQMLDSLKQDDSTLVLHAGDFTDGSIMIAADGGGGDLNLLKAMEVDAAVIGNHEVAFGPEGLATMIQAAEKPMVPLLCSNIEFSDADTPLGHSDDALEALYSESPKEGGFLHRSYIKTLSNGTRVGFFGLMGEKVLMPDSIPLQFPIRYREVQKLVDELQAEADVVICLMHASAGEDEDGNLTGEAGDLARHVQGINLIVAGHSHSIFGLTQIPDKKKEWTTAAMEAGDDFDTVAQALLVKTDEDWMVERIEHHAVNESTPASPEIKAFIQNLRLDVEEQYLRQFPQIGDGKVFDALAELPFTLTPEESIKLVADSMREMADSDVAFCTPGGDSALIRTQEGEQVTLYDAFAAMPHSWGQDGTHGGMLYKFQLRADELRLLADFGTAFLGQMTPDMYLVPSGMEFTINTSKLPLRRLQRLTLKDGTLLYERGSKGRDWKVGKHDLYTVSTSLLTLYGLKYLSETLPLLDLWPRDEEGKKVKWNMAVELDDFIVMKTDDSGREYPVKAWYALASWLYEQGEIPAQYQSENSDSRILDLASAQ